MAHEHKVWALRASSTRAARGSLRRVGCTTVICSGKTGTLTLNQIAARRVACGRRRYRVEGEGYEARGRIVPEVAGEVAAPLAELLAAVAAPLAELLAAVAAPLAELLAAVVACDDSPVADGRVIGDPMECALVVLGAKGGVSADSIAARAANLRDSLRRHPQDHGDLPSRRRSRRALRQGRAGGARGALHADGSRRGRRVLRSGASSGRRCRRSRVRGGGPARAARRHA